MLNIPQSDIKRVHGSDKGFRDSIELAKISGNSVYGVSPLAVSTPFPITKWGRRNKPTDRRKGNRCLEGSPRVPPIEGGMLLGKWALVRIADVRHRPFSGIRTAKPDRQRFSDVPILSSEHRLAQWREF